MSIREVIEMLKALFEIFSVVFGNLFGGNEEGGEEAGDAENA